MLVTFISQCEKNALKRTRRILDAFANRIGDNVWQTAITVEGLNTVKKLLKASASVSTAVSCHRVKTRHRTELVWIVGRKQKFNDVGIVPVNYTDKNIATYQDSQQWKTLPLITHASVISALFHDFGKATLLFQNKINPNIDTEKYEPYRHEWVSLRLFEAFVYSVDELNDANWLLKLANADFDTIKQPMRDGLEKTKNKNPLVNLPPFAQLVGWLILSHHKLPLFPHWDNSKTKNKPTFVEIDKWFSNKLSALWNSPKCDNEEEQERIADNWSFQQLPYESKKWASYVCVYVSNHQSSIITQIANTNNLLHDDLFTSHIARLALTLADHSVSSYSIEDTQSCLQDFADNKYTIYANTDYLDDKITFKQQLDQHLIGVAKQAEKISKKLPRLHHTLPSLVQNDELEKKITKLDIKANEKLKHFQWQNACISTAEKIAKQTLQHGFFGINMASTGTGKTRANAKIMYALGRETNQVRFNVALGLRTLTLQTGKEFQQDLHIADKDISIAVGGIAVKELFAKNQAGDNQSDQIDTGSDSQNDYLNSEFSTEFKGEIVEHALYKWTTKRHKKHKHRTNKLLQPPILVCTIDHLIPATEGIRGGQQIAPMLRLMTSDLILDEPDDFSLTDLPALCRLVHWTGLLGRRVLLSTATMPPVLVYACFEAYRAGWKHYAKANLDSWDGNIQCAWFDEFNTLPKGNASDTNDTLIDDFVSYKNAHNKFVKARIEKLESMLPKRKGKIVQIVEDASQSVYKNMATTIHNSINELHNTHHIKHETFTNKKISVGLVRMANIDPMVAVAKCMMQIDTPENTCIHYVVYHSRFPLAVRSHIEEKLDYLLKRKDSERIWKAEKGLGTLIQDSNTDNHIFVVIASPVAEVGRDHDYDWAVIEPSSMRSIVQIAGRVLRHREIYPSQANIHLLNKNIKGLIGKKICFKKPGFESEAHPLNTHTLKTLLHEADYLNIDAISNITDFENLDRTIVESSLLTELEYKSLYSTLLNDNYSANNASKWWLKPSQWTGELQYLQKFRQSSLDETYHLFVENEFDKPKFQWFNPKDKDRPFTASKNKGTELVIEREIQMAEGVQLWFDLEPIKVYQQLQHDFNKTKRSYDLKDISEKFGAVKITEYDDKPKKYTYHVQLGVYTPL